MTQHTQRQDLVPGVMRCAKCEFQLQRVNLYVQSGTAGAGDSNTEPCPNGCGPLWPVTWKQWAEQLQDSAERLAVERNELLVAAKKYIACDGSGGRFSALEVGNARLDLIAAIVKAGG